MKSFAPLIPTPRQLWRGEKLRQGGGSRPGPGRTTPPAGHLQPSTPGTFRRLPGEPRAARGPGPPGRGAGPKPRPRLPPRAARRSLLSRRRSGRPRGPRSPAWPSAATMLQKREKVLLLKTFQGRTLRIVREHYLRPSVPCNSPLCSQPTICLNGQGPGGSEGGRGGNESRPGRARTRRPEAGREGSQAGKSEDGGAGVVCPLRPRRHRVRGPRASHRPLASPSLRCGLGARGGGPRAAEMAVVGCFWSSPCGTPRRLRPMKWQGPETGAPHSPEAG